MHVSDTLEPLTIPLNIPFLPFSSFASTALEAHVPEREDPSCEIVALKSAFPTNASFVIPTHVPASDGVEGDVDEWWQATAAMSIAMMNGTPKRAMSLTPKFWKLPQIANFLAAAFGSPNAPSVPPKCLPVQLWIFGASARPRDRDAAEVGKGGV